MQVRGHPPMNIAKARGETLSMPSVLILLAPYQNGPAMLRHGVESNRSEILVSQQQ
jgi:hypothetical protein